MVLDPPPRNFTNAKGLDAAKIVDAVTNGRKDTAMQPFAGILSEQEIAAVAAFVAERFVGCKDPNTRYHTLANGWPDHEARYAAAFPFVEGAVPVDAPADSLTPELLAGRTLFRSACVSCHEGRLETPSALGLRFEEEARDDGRDDHGEEHGAGHEDEYDVKTIHDEPPVIADLAAEEARGRDLYMAACEQCHAADGSGLNWIGKFLDPSPPDFTKPDFAQGFSAAGFAASLLEPPPDISMPAFSKVLSEEDAAAIAAYVRRAFIAGSAR